jgi:hypothetical protein
MRLRLLQAVTGRFLAGSIVEVDDFEAPRYLHDHTAELVAADPQSVDEKAHFPDKEWMDDLQAEESAVAEPKVESATVKRRGRPKRVKPAAEWHDENAPGWKEVKQE